MGILDEDPSISIEQKDIGQLMEMAVKGGKAGNKDIELGIYGERGSELRFIYFCYRIGLNYVSCSPLRVPVVRLVVARAVMNNNPGK